MMMMMRPSWALGLQQPDLGLSVSLDSSRNTYAPCQQPSADLAFLKTGKTHFSGLLEYNRLTVLNGQIKLDWLNLSLTAFKLKVKRTFLNN